MSTLGTLAPAADTELFADTLSCELRLPAGFHVTADPGSHATAETLLRSLGQVEDLRSEDSSEERGELPLLVQRMDAKLDLILALIGRLVRQSDTPWRWARCIGRCAASGWPARTRTRPARLAAFCCSRRTGFLNCYNCLPTSWRAQAMVNSTGCGYALPHWGPVCRTPWNVICFVCIAVRSPTPVASAEPMVGAQAPRRLRCPLQKKVSSPPCESSSSTITPLFALACRGCCRPFPASMWSAKRAMRNKPWT